MIKKILLMCLILSMVALAIYIIYSTSYQNCKSDEMKSLKKHLFSYLHLMKKVGTFHPEKKSYTFFCELENRHHLAIAIDENIEVIYLEIRNPNYELSATFSDYISNDEPYPIWIGGVFYIESFSNPEKLKQGISRKYLLVLEHGITELVKASEDKN